MLSSLRVILGAAAIVAAHGGHDHDQVPIEGPHKSLWYNSLPGDGGTQASFRCVVGIVDIVIDESRLIQSSLESLHSVGSHTINVY
jgi:hypothetical protein